MHLLLTTTRSSTGVNGRMYSQYILSFRTTSLALMDPSLSTSVSVFGGHAFRIALLNNMPEKVRFAGPVFEGESCNISEDFFLLFLLRLGGDDDGCGVIVSVTLGLIGVGI